jgi:predicted lipid-binding transport protein (Tim44 family)
VRILRWHSHRVRIIASALAVVAVVPLLGGCGSSEKGSSGPSPSPTPKALTHEEYVNQAIVICSVSAQKTAPQPATAADYAAAVRAQIVELKDLQAKLEALEPPAADKKKLQEQLLDPKAKTIKVFEDALPDVQKAAATGDLDATRKAFTPAAQEAINLASGAAPFLSSYGLAACS